jgi:hypothetical protein
MIIPALMGTLKPASQVIDPYTVLLCHFNGADGSTTMTDAMGRHSLTRAGDAQIDTDESKFGGASVLCDGTGDYVTSAASSDFAFGSGDFTVEYFLRFKMPAGQDQYVLTLNDYAAGVPGWSAATFEAYRTNIADTTFRISGGTYTDTMNWVDSTQIYNVNTWHHVALVRYGNTLSLYVNGSSVGTPVTLSGSVANTGVTGVTVAARTTGSVYSALYTGHIDELRVSKGIARYTSTFTPPSAEFSP